jgi:hypothetical protein
LRKRAESLFLRGVFLFLSDARDVIGLYVLLGRKLFNYWGLGERDNGKRGHTREVLCFADEGNFWV